MKEFLSTNVGKALKVALWVAVSALLGSIVADIANDPQLFGPATGLINVLLVFVQKTWFSPDTKNLGN